MICEVEHVLTVKGENFVSVISFTTKGVRTIQGKGGKTVLIKEPFNIGTSGDRLEFPDY